MNLKTSMPLIGSLLLSLSGAAEEIPLLMPPVIYATPGVEMNVYFDNIVRVSNPANYNFDVDCPKGRNDAKRWRFTASNEDAGTFKWKLTVYKDDAKVGEAEASLIVSPSDAGKGKSITYLAVGASTTEATIYPARVYELMQKEGNPEFKMVGSMAGHKKPATPEDKIVHEGYGGWTYQTFLNRPDSPFIIDGKLDFKAYCDKFNNGKAPDFISVMLGANTAFGMNENNMTKETAKMVKDMETLLTEFRRVGPDTQIGLALVYPCASSQDAFGANYKCKITRSQYIRYQFALNNALLESFSKMNDPKISIVPNVINMDGENNFPSSEETVNAASQKKTMVQNNALHPNRAGYIQYGDSFYSWLKCRLAQMEEKKN